MAARGADADDAFPQVRAGVAYGDVVSRLGDVFGPTVNIASRLTSLARPGTVVLDDGAHDALAGVRRLHVAAAAAHLGQGLRPPAAVGAQTLPVIASATRAAARGSNRIV